MAISQIGMLIKRRRTELGLTQEELADGICAVTTLSRIENGERMPTQNHLEILLQRIGYSDLMLQSYVNENEFLAHDLKFKIRQAYILGDNQLARELFVQLEQLLSSPKDIDKQFLLLWKVLLYPENYSNEARTLQLEEAICLTQPNYKRGKVPYLLSYEEIILLNNLATAYAKCGQRELSIEMLYRIVAYYDAHVVNMEESLRTQPLTLYNLSKSLGLEQRYDECIEICDRGIRLAQRSWRMQMFAQTLYNKAWALVRRNQEGDLAEAKEAAQNAQNVAAAFGMNLIAEHCRRFMEEHKLL